MRDLKVVCGVEGWLDGEGMGVMRRMGKWKGGMEEGKGVRVKFSVGVSLMVEGRKKKGK